MKPIQIRESWCLGCHLCEYYCTFAHSGKDDMVSALKGVTIHPRIRIESKGTVNFAVACRHCHEPLCVKGCITGALSVKDGVVRIDSSRCVGCYTCILLCPFGAVMPGPDGHAAQKCELCTTNAQGEPACVKGCPNRAILWERG